MFVQQQNVYECVNQKVEINLNKRNLFCYIFYIMNNTLYEMVFRTAYLKNLKIIVVEIGDFLSKVSSHIPR